MCRVFTILIFVLDGICVVLAFDKEWFLSSEWLLLLCMVIFFTPVHVLMWWQIDEAQQRLVDCTKCLLNTIRAHHIMMEASTTLEDCIDNVIWAQEYWKNVDPAYSIFGVSVTHSFCKLMYSSQLTIVTTLLMRSAGGSLGQFIDPTALSSLQKIPYLGVLMRFLIPEVE